MQIGIISDTHDLLRPEVLKNLQGCDWILHGGDISSRKILDQLEAIAPVKAVRGNNDKDWAETLPTFLDFERGGLRICMTHKKKDLPDDLSPYNLAVRDTFYQCFNEMFAPKNGNKKLEGQERSRLYEFMQAVVQASQKHMMPAIKEYNNWETKLKNKEI